MSFKSTPRNIALLSASGAGIFIFTYLLIIQPKEGNLPQYLLLTGIVVVLGFIVNLFLFRSYIHNRVKIIYRNIFSQKLDGGIDNKIKALSMSEDVVDSVGEEVKEWATSKTKEIQILKELEQYRKDFIGNVSHELKTPIFNIQGYILTLLEGGLEDENINRKFLERALKSVDRMTTLVEDLDLITRLESQQLELKNDRFQLSSLVLDIFNSLEILASNANVKLISKVADNIYVKGDQSRIRQVIVNLVVNSIKYSNESDALTEVRAHDMDEKYLIEVSDNGIGIAKEHLPRLFERFYRTDKSRSRDEGGSGLGLAIVKHIIEAHQQTLNVRSTEQVGSTFSFTLEKG